MFNQTLPNISDATLNITLETIGTSCYNVKEMTNADINKIIA